MVFLKEFIHFCIQFINFKVLFKVHSLQSSFSIQNSLFTEFIPHSLQSSFLKCVHSIFLFWVNNLQNQLWTQFILHNLHSLQNSFFTKSLFYYHFILCSNFSRCSFSTKFIIFSLLYCPWLPLYFQCAK